MILSRVDELIELAKKYIEKGYKTIDAIKMAERELEEVNNGGTKDNRSIKSIKGRM